jgi:hypothetical protein
MSEWKKRRAQTSEVYRCKRCGYVKKHYAWKKIALSLGKSIRRFFVETIISWNPQEIIGIVELGTTLI